MILLPRNEEIRLECIFYLTSERQKIPGYKKKIPFSTLSSSGIVGASSGQYVGSVVSRFNFWWRICKTEIHVRFTIHMVAGNSNWVFNAFRVPVKWIPNWKCWKSRRPFHGSYTIWALSIIDPFVYYLSTVLHQTLLSVFISNVFVYQIFSDKRQE